MRALGCLEIVVAVMLLLVYGLGGVMQGFQRIQPPSVQVTSKNLRTGTVSLDYVAWVDVSVHNSGGHGTVTVRVEVTRGSDAWKKSQTIYLDAKGSKMTSKAASRIQSHSDRTGKNLDFKARAQRAASKKK